MDDKVNKGRSPRSLEMHPCVKRLFRVLAAREIARLYHVAGRIDFYNGRVLTIEASASIINMFARLWRNRHTRTFEGRVGDRTGSSPVNRTMSEWIVSHPLRLFIKFASVSSFFYRPQFARADHAATFVFGSIDPN